MLKLTDPNYLVAMKCPKWFIYLIIIFLWAIRGNISSKSCYSHTLQLWYRSDLHIHVTACFLPPVGVFFPTFFVSDGFFFSVSATTFWLDSHRFSPSTF